jgi:small subunit ribosomal protein S21
MNGVNIRSNENIERALRRFKKICEDSGILTEIKLRKHFEKPSVTNRLKRKSAIRKAQKAKEEDERLFNRPY